MNALTILVSSFLLFLVQPIIAKQIVPWFGGSAAVWTTCLMFFQVVLLAGYTYSDAVQRIRPRLQSGLHIALLLVSLLALPILASEQWKPTGHEDPTLRIVGLLTMTIGLPYLMLATTGPLVQSWFARSQPDASKAQRAYRLFALSNFGSLMGLLAYPFVIEPWVSTKIQAMMWSGVYVAFVLLAGFLAWRASQAHPSNGDAPGASAPEPHDDDHQPPGAQDYGVWFALAAIATMMLLSVSSHITQNIASIPFLWVVPLSLYLLTFVIAFEGRRGRGWYLRDSMMLPAMVLAAFMAWGLVTDDGILDIDYAIPLYLAGLFLGCLFCHGELAQAKPRARFLTRFYLMIALGGAMGGVFVSMVAPRVFTLYWELPLSLGLLAAAGVWVGLQHGVGPLKTVFVGGSLLSLAVTIHYATSYESNSNQDSIYASRNFYGTLRVSERFYSGGQEPVRRLIHGVILHGLQDMNPGRRQQPTTYYGPTSGVGLTLAEKGALSPKGLRVGVIGLGVGTLAAYGRRGDHYRMYEINQEVINLAKTEFTYLTDSPAEISFALGDARLVLEREASNQFDVLVIDAFSSDSIPIHLVTREAMAIYRKHLKSDGVIAFHVTNRYLDLAPVVEGLAKDAGMTALLVSDDPTDERFRQVSYSDWVLVTQDQRLMASPKIQARQYAIDSIPGLKVWTDDFNNLFKVLK